MIEYIIGVIVCVLGCTLATFYYSKWKVTYLEDRKDQRTEASKKVDILIEQIKSMSALKQAEMELNAQKPDSNEMGEMMTLIQTFLPVLTGSQSTLQASQPLEEQIIDSSPIPEATIQNQSDESIFKNSPKLKEAVENGSLESLVSRYMNL